MTMKAPTPRPGVMDITPYVGGESTLEGVSRVIKLASNEGALGASPRAIDAYRAASSELHRYPDGGCTALRQAIGARYGLDPARIVCGAGSDELLGLLCRAYAGPGDEVLYSAHGFLMYAIAAKTAGATPVTAPESNLTANVDNLLGAVTDRTRILFLANPNNPTGSYLPAEELRRLRAGLRDDILLVIDAAYAEFVSRNDYTPGTELVDAGNNTIMTRTFSKIHGLSALRLGWAYGPENVIDVLNRVRNPFNVSTAAQAAGLAAIQDLEFERLSREHNDYWLEWLGGRLRDLGLEVPPSVANFLLVRFKDAAEAEKADAFLRARGIIVRRMGGYGLPESLRVTIGREDENRALVDAFTEFVAE